MRFAEIRGSGLGSVIAENNSTQFYIKIVGTNFDYPGDKRGDTGVYVNNEKIIAYAKLGRGINVGRFDENMKFVESQFFDLYGDFVNQSQRLIDYVNANSSGLLAMFSHDAIGVGEKISKPMREWGASSWAYHIPEGQRPRYSWCGLLDLKTKNMVSDAAGGKGYEFPAMIDYYIDTMDDMGTTGAGQVVIQDPVEYSGKGRYLIQEYIKRSVMSEVLPQVKAGEWMYLRCDMKQDAAATAAGVKSLYTMQFYNSAGTYLKAININVNPGDSWKTFEVKGEVPVGAYFVELGFFHYPSTSTNEGIVFIKNAVAQPISKEVDKKLPARLGRFTAPSKEFREGTLSGSTVVKFTKDELLEASEMQELSYGEWIKVFEHRMLDQNFLFANSDDGLYSEVPYLYSNMKMLPDLRLQDGRWRFKMVYGDKFIIWEQSSSVEDNVAAGYKLIETNMTGMREMKGLRRTTAAAVDSSRYTGSVASNEWYYAVGAMKMWKDGIPGFDVNLATRHVQLYAWKE